MNIFVTSDCPIECARSLDDKRVVKMVLESTQMLCTALNELAGDRICQYKSTHVNHPCNIWVRTSYQNWQWLYAHAKALSTEYTKRYSKFHKCNIILNRLPDIVLTVINKFPETGRTPFANCARNLSLNVDYSDVDDVHMAYQCYMADRWETDKRIPTFYGVRR
jgi:hypothetical protein